MRKFLSAALLGMLLAAVPAAASAQPPRPDRRDDVRRDSDRRDDDRRDNDRRDGDRRGPQNAMGNWNNNWGARPPAPPRHYSNRGNWYGHVRSCQQRYRNYNPRTDTYSVRRGVNRRCTL